MRDPLYEDSSGERTEFAKGRDKRLKEEEKMVNIRWSTCECDVLTRYCDEFHTGVARIPLSKIEQWIEEGR